MSAADWFFGVLVGPLLLIGGWTQCYRVWRHRAEVGTGVQWVTGRGNQAGFHAFLLPSTIGLTLIWFGLALEALRSSLADPLPLLGPTVTYLLVGGLASILVGFWLWLFTWPEFLVPPHLRRGAPRTHHPEKGQ